MGAREKEERKRIADSGWERQLNETKGNRRPDDWLGILCPQHSFRFPISLGFAASPNRQPLTANRLLGDDLVVTQQKTPAGAGVLVGR